MIYSTSYYSSPKKGLAGITGCLTLTKLNKRCFPPSTPKFITLTINDNTMRLINQHRKLSDDGVCHVPCAPRSTAVLIAVVQTVKF
jgi:hypothetical protein